MQNEGKLIKQARLKSDLKPSSNNFEWKKGASEEEITEIEKKRTQILM